jgi:hypothetical protein
VEIAHLRVCSLERVVKCGGRDARGGLGLGGLERHRARHATRRNGLAGGGARSFVLERILANPTRAAGRGNFARREVSVFRVDRASPGG